MKLMGISGYRAVGSRFVTPKPENILELVRATGRSMLTLYCQAPLMRTAGTVLYM